MLCCHGRELQGVRASRQGIDRIHWHTTDPLPGGRLGLRALTVQPTHRIVRLEVGTCGQYLVANLVRADIIEALEIHQIAQYT